MTPKANPNETAGVNRRTVLKGLGAGAAAAALSGPTIIMAQGSDKSPAAVTVGSGEHRYELVEGWGKLPDGKAFGYTHGVCVDAAGQVYVHNMSQDSMCVFDPDGKFIKSWGKEYQGGAHGLQYSKEAGGEFLYLATTGLHTVVKTTLDGEVVWTLGHPKESGSYDKDPNRFVPTNVAIAPNGDFYVADGYGLSWIHQYNAKAEYVRSFGGPGKEPGQLFCPHGIAVDTRGAEPLVLVADRSNVRLQYFTLDGKFVRVVEGELRHPCHFDQRNGDLLIPDLHGRVTIFNKEDKLAVHLGDNPDVQKTKGYPNLPHDQRIPGKFISPHGACWDRQGNLIVAEWVNDGRVSFLRHVA